MTIKTDILVKAVTQPWDFWFFFDAHSFCVPEPFQHANEGILGLVKQAVTGSQGWVTAFTRMSVCDGHLGTHYRFCGAWQQPSKFTVDRHRINFSTYYFSCRRLPFITRSIKGIDQILWIGAVSYMY